MFIHFRISLHVLWANFQRRSTDHHQPSITRLYRVHAAGASIHLEPVPVCFDSLDPDFVFVLDSGYKIFIWYGKTAKSTLKSKARLMAEKIKQKRKEKNKAEILTEIMKFRIGRFSVAFECERHFATHQQSLNT